MTLPIVFGSKSVQLAIQPNIGLDASARQSVVEILNILLADEAMLMFKAHGALELTGETGDTGLAPLIDGHCQLINALSKEIMERIQILGGLQLQGPEELIKMARLDAKPIVPGVFSVLADQETFIRFLREDVLKCTDIFEDQGTFALLVSILRKHEKMAWMLRSYIENRPVQGESPKGV